MKFSDVEPKFLRKLDAPHYSYKKTSQVSFSSTEDLLNVSLSTTGKLDYDSPLVDCWPLYPFDPNEVYLSEDVWFPSDDDATWREISHWSEPDVSLGGLPPDAYDAQVMASGDLIYGGKQLTPDWCNHRGEREPLPLPSPLGNDPGVPGPCDAQANPALETRVGLTGEILFRCEAKPDSWQADNGKVVVSTDLGELLSVGAQNTLMLSTGLLRRDADADGVASCADADAAATVTTSQFGVLLPLANLTRTQIIATRARPDGYWVAVNGETAAELWHVDFSGCSEQLGVYPEEPKVFDRFIAQLDGYGRLFELEPYGLSGLSVRSLDGSSSSRDVSADRFITGP
jgi:hypothetical protein